ncbi:MAG TPA: NlpC/P60 family protein, partial [Campylobacterales bacterium]|nr:NlpC/P60 family protein [Campylobacterales bacterium]
MERIRNILLFILLIQFLIFLYVKLIYEAREDDVHYPESIIEKVELETLVNQSIYEIVDGGRELPQSSEFTVWDQEMIAQLNKEIELFNEEMEKVVQANLSQPTTPNTEKKLVSKTIEKAEKSEKMNKEKEKIAKIEKKKPQPSTTKKVVQFAKKNLGKKYVWGATGPNNFDCSGFTKEVFKCTIGINIPRVSRDQAKVGTYVEFSELRRGDMVFFDTEKKYTGKVNHVGIYLSN